MQDFEVYGRTMQLGWGQENRDEQPFKSECSRESKISQQQYGKVRVLVTGWSMNINQLNLYF